MSNETSATFESFHVGWTFVPDILKPCHLTVADVDLAGAFDFLVFKGDITGLADPHNDRYHLIPPAGVSRTTGALAKPDDLGEGSGYDDRGPMWLWSGYLYVPPQVGHDVSSTTYGTKDGDNFLGQYHTWNRVYDIRSARWTTPDPAASPWTNLWSYCGSNPVTGADPNGLRRHEAPAGRVVDKDVIDPDDIGGPKKSAEAKSKSEGSRVYTGSSNEVRFVADDPSVDWKKTSEM